MKKIIALLLAALPSLLFAQAPPVRSTPLADLRNTETLTAYYISRDGVRFEGLRIGIRQPDRLFILEQPGHPRATLRPSQVREYGFEGGARYIGATYRLDGREYEVFLEAIVDDPEFSVLLDDSRSKPEFFLQRDGQTLRITDGGKELRTLMRARAEACPARREIDRYPLELTRTSIMRLYDAYANCNTHVLPRPVRFGIGGGIGYEQITTQRRHRSRFGAYPTLFVAFPLDARVDLLAEVSYRSAKVDYEHELRGETLLDRRSLCVPLIARYTFTGVRSRWMPLIGAGVAFDFLIGGGCSRFERRDMASFMWGGVGEAGVEYRITRRNSLFFTLRYSFLGGKSRHVDRTTERSGFAALHIGCTF